MKKFFGLLLVAFFGLLSLGAFAQDTLVTSKGKYVLKDAYYAADTTFMFAAKIEKVFISEVAPIDNCRQVVNWDNTKFTKVIDANTDFVNYTVATDNPKAKVEYSADNVIWQDSPVLKLRNSTNCEGIFLRLKGCENVSTWGCVVPFAETEIITPPVVVVGKKYVEPKSYDVFSRVALPAQNNSQYYLGADQLEAGDKSKMDGLAGFNYFPLVVLQGKQRWDVKEWKQDFVFTADPVTTFTDNNSTYYFRPQYDADNTSQLADFDLKFPDFKLPSGKMTVMQMTNERQKQLKNYTNKGITYALETDVSKRYAFVSDDWLYELGCPQAYQSSQKDFDEWLRVTPANSILESFKRRIIPFKDYGYIMLNWEAVANRAFGEHREKIKDCLRWYKQQKYNAKLSAWNETPIKISRIQMEQDSRAADYTGAVNYTGLLADFREKYKRRIQYHGDDYAKNLDVLHVGGYMNYPTNFSTIHHYILEFQLNKKFYPGKTILATIWPTQELIGDFPLGRRDFSNYYCWIKPAVFPQTMFNWGVWSVAVGDGFDCWFDPVYSTNDKTKQGFDCFRNGRLKQSNPEYPHNSLKNVDDLMAGVWAVSIHKDIIDAKTSWVWNMTADESLFSKKPLVATKLSADGKEMLILLYDAFNGEKITEHFVLKPLNFGGGGAMIKAFGTRTSVVRVKL